MILCVFSKLNSVFRRKAFVQKNDFWEWTLLYFCPCVISFKLKQSIQFQKNKCSIIKIILGWVAGKWSLFQKNVLLNFRPKQANKWIGVHMTSLFLLFIAFLTWPNLTCSNRPLSLFFHPLTLPGYPLFCCLFSENWKKIEIKRSGVQLLNFLLLA
jgi:hypothetical protein